MRSAIHHQLLEIIDLLWNDLKQHGFDKSDFKLKKQTSNINSGLPYLSYTHLGCNQFRYILQHMSNHKDAEDRIDVRDTLSYEDRRIVLY